jgi:hypothetical protein
MNVLAICYYAPPQLTPQAIQIGRQLYHLDAEVTLLHGRDPQFARAYDQYPDFFDVIDALAVDNPGTPLPGVLHRAAMRLLPLYGACPDLFGPWRRKARGPALRHIAATRPDALVSFGMPMTDHLLALDLKRATGVPWLAHFSDPWADNPFHETSALEHQVNAAMERRVIAQADGVLFTSARTLELVMKKYPASWREKAAVLPHAWDMDHFSQPLAARAPSDPVRKVIRHIGACYGARSPEPLFAALARIAERTPRLLDGVTFEFIGHVSQAFLDCAALAALPPGLVVLRGQVGYRASLQLARDASALLVIDAPSATDSIFLPSKLVEYLGADRPVWGMTPPGTSADLIAEWSGGSHLCADPSDVEAVARMVTAGLAALDQGSARGGADAVAQRFSAARVAQALRQYIEQAIARCVPRTAPGTARSAATTAPAGSKRDTFHEAAVRR